MYEVKFYFSINTLEWILTRMHFWLCKKKKKEYVILERLLKYFWKTYQINVEVLTSITPWLLHFILTLTCVKLVDLCENFTYHLQASLFMSRTASVVLVMVLFLHYRERILNSDVLFEQLFDSFVPVRVLLVEISFSCCKNNTPGPFFSVLSNKTITNNYTIALFSNFRGIFACNLAFRCLPPKCIIIIPDLEFRRPLNRFLKSLNKLEVLKK